MATAMEVMQVNPSKTLDVATDLPSMASFYAGRTILITGVSGFVGKVLMEKILRALPDTRILLLVRAKWGKSAQDRVSTFTQTPLFERLREERPEALAERVTVMEGDVTQPGLGLSADNKRKVLEEVSVVYHLAALVRLEAPLRPAMLHNVTATRNVLELCLQMTKLDCFVHVSTAFCHPDVENLEERLYGNDVFPKDVEEMLSWMSDENIEANMPKLLKLHPNCYTFTKRLAELLVGEYVGRLPIIIARPSIVTPSLAEPMPGWVDSLNGPIGIVVGSGKGVIRSLMCRKDLFAEVIPVDIAANALLITVWHKVLTAASPNQIMVYNLTQNDITRVSWGEVLDKGRKLLFEYPFDGVVWYPDGDMRDSRFTHNLIVFCFQTVPAYLIDGVLALAGQKTFLVRLQKRILFGLSLLEFFTTRKWSFENQFGKDVSRLVSPADSKIFPCADAVFDVDEYLKASLIGARVYCMKEPLSNLPRARRHLKVLLGVHYLAIIGFWCLIFWMFYRLFQAATAQSFSWEV